MTAPLHQRHPNRAALPATEPALGQIPAIYSPALGQAIVRAVAQGMQRYPYGLDTLSRQLRPPRPSPRGPRGSGRALRAGGYNPCP